MRFQQHAVMVVLSLVGAQLSTAGVIIRCVKDGKISYTDTMCEDTKPPLPSVPAAVAAGTEGPAKLALGEWRGQSQFHFTVANQSVEQAHTVVPLSVKLDVDGKVLGSSPENGCQWLGLWTPGLTGAVVNLDVSLSNCRFPQLNQRYRGDLSAVGGDGRGAQLALSAANVGVLTSASSAEIKANLRR